MMVNNDGYGVYADQHGKWWFKTYKVDDLRHGPFESRALAMEMLLTQIGFDVADDSTVSPQDGRAAAAADFVGWVDTWVSNPVGAYSVHALDGLFRMARDKIAAIRVLALPRADQ